MKFSFGRKSKARAAAEHDSGVAAEGELDAATDGLVHDGEPIQEMRQFPVKTAKKKRSLSLGPKRARFDAGDVQIGIELENERRLYFLAGSDGQLKRLDDERVPDVPLISAFRTDTRIFAPSPLSGAKARGYAARESDALDRLTLINDSRRGRIYTAPYADVGPGEIRVPLTQVLDDLLGDRRGQFIAGVLLGSDDLAILYAYNDGVMGAKQLQVSVNPENLQAVASSFASMAGMHDDVDIIVFEHAELIQRLKGKSWTPYPVANGFYGIPKSAFVPAALGVTGAIAAGCMGFAGYWYFKDVSLRHQAALEKKQATEAVDQLGREILLRKSAFANNTSVNVLSATAMASKLVTPGALVEARLSRSIYNFSVISDFFRPSDVGNSMALNEAIAHEPIAGCVKQSMQATGGMREIDTQYGCAVLGPNLSRFGW